MPSEKPVCSGLVDRIGLDHPTITHKVFHGDEELVFNLKPEIDDHAGGLREVVNLLTDPVNGVIGAPSEIEAVGHRIVHGGDTFTSTTVITAELKEKLKHTFQLAPLHNPSGYRGIEVAEKIFSNAVQIAVFDTAFHQTMPAEAYRFAIPDSFYTEHHIRVYGFHGISHNYVSRQVMDYLRKPDAKLITIHLGNGCSMAAVDGGKCIDTSMGFGPLSGLIMGTRCGDIDGTVIFYLVNQLGYDIAQVNNLLNKQSGMLGLTGYSDMRDVTKAINAGDENAELAYEMYAHRIKKYIGAYAAALNGLDGIIFTAGVGENDAEVRRRVCTNMEYLGINLNNDENSIRKPGLREINTPESRVKIFIVPTNEELEIANECYGMLK